MKITSEGALFLILIIAFSIFVYFKIEATELDMESFKWLVPSEQCYGAKIPEMEVSIWWCAENNEEWTELDIYGGVR